MSLDTSTCDPFILLVHHRHAFRPLDFFRPLFSAVIMPEGFPAHPHRGFETVTYVLPKRSGLVHRDSLGCKMSYGDGAVQWMTAGRGMLHEEMWDVDKPNEDFELYQLWVNLPPQHKFTPPRCQLLTPQGAPAAAAVEREGRLSDVRRAEIPIIEAQGGKVTVRLLAGELDGVRGGAETFSPMTLAHVELRGHGTAHSVAVPVGWTCFAYVRRGKVDVGAGEVGMFEMAYFAEGGDGVRITALSEEADVMLFAGEPIGAPVASSGTMVMNTQQQLQEAMSDYRRGTFGIPWDHALEDEQWADHCAGITRPS